MYCLFFAFAEEFRNATHLPKYSEIWTQLLVVLSDDELSELETFAKTEQYDFIISLLCNEREQNRI